MKIPPKSKRPSLIFVLILGLSLFLFFISEGYSPAEPPRPIKLAQNDTLQLPDQVTRNASKNVTLDFNNVDIKLVIKFMSDLLGKNFLIDDNVKGNVTIISPQAVPVDEAYKVFESILEVKGFAAIPSGSIIKIVPTREAFSKNIETRTEAQVKKIKPEDTYITQLIPIEHADVNEIKTVVSSLISKETKLITYGPTNTLILTDTLSNIDRLVKIIKEIDVPSEETRIEIVALQYAAPDVIANEVLKAIGDQQVTRAVSRTKRRTVVPKEATKMKIIPDERTGSLIIVAQEEEMKTVLELIEMLDIPTPRGKDNIRVRALKNSKAEDVSKVLGNIISQQRAQAKKAGSEAAPLIEGSQVTADKATNSLIITAPPQDYEILSRIIDELDVMRTQVLVEALIAEVTFGKQKELGVEWRAGVEKITSDGSGSEYQGFGGTSFGQIASVQSGVISGDLPQGMFLGVAKGTIKVGGIEFPNVAALIRAYQRDQDVNILSTPHILTTDNEEAKIHVGQSISYPRSEISNNITTQSYIYKDVGITLKLTPYINPDGYVKLEISLKIDNVIAGSSTDAPWTTKREAETTVVVRDQQTVVIGGLLKDDQSDTYNRVPCLGEIPLVGWLFRSMAKRKDKTNLQVFLTPHIIRTPEDLLALTLEKSSSLEKEDIKLDLLDEEVTQSQTPAQGPELETGLSEERPDSQTAPEGTEIPEDSGTNDQNRKNIEDREETSGKRE